MMQDIILGRIWADHHQRVYGDAGEPIETRSRPARLPDAASLPAAGKALVLALGASLISLGSSLATVAIV